MKKKYCKQLLIYFIEVAVMSSILVWLSSYITPIKEYYEIIERFLANIVIYQGIIFICNKNILDTEKDMLLSMKTYLEYCKLYLEYENKSILKDIKSILEKLDNKNIFIRCEYLQSMKEIYKVISNDEIKKEEKRMLIDYKLIDISHKYEKDSLKWKYTLLLKLFK